MLIHLIEGRGEGGAEKVASLLAAHKGRLIALGAAHPDLRRIAPNIRALRIPEDHDAPPGGRLRILERRVGRVRMLRGLAVVAHDDASHEAAALAAAAGGLPVVRVVHTSLDGVGDPFRTFRLYSPVTSFYFCVEKKTCHYAERLRLKSIFMPQPLDVERLRPAPTLLKGLPTAHSRREPRLLFVGRLERAKGVDVLLEAFARIAPRTNAQLWIAGDGPEYPNLAHTVVRKRLADRVHFLGYISDVGNLYRAADLLAIPSRAEGGSLVALESIASGTPVIAAAVGGLRELLWKYRLKDSLVRPENPGALANALRSFCRTPEPFKTAVGKVRPHVIKMHQASKIAGWMIEIVKKELRLHPTP